MVAEEMRTMWVSNESDGPETDRMRRCAGSVRDET